MSRTGQIERLFSTLRLLTAHFNHDDRFHLCNVRTKEARLALHHHQYRLRLLSEPHSMLTLLFNSVYKYKHSHLYLAFQFICKQTHMCMFVSTYRYIKLRQICGKFGKLCCSILAFVCYYVDTYKTKIDMSILF